MKLRAALALFFITSALSAGELDLWPWEKEKRPAPPESAPYSLPTLNGKNTDYEAPIPALVKAPNVPAEEIFKRVIECYPSKSHWKLDLELEARISDKESTRYDLINSGITSNYIALVARMPLYSYSELDREREREYRRRADTAKAVADFVRAIAERNKAFREVALYTSLEARSRIRVQQGIVDASEQVKYLEKTADAQAELIKWEAEILEARLKLAASCAEGKDKMMNEYLARLAELPEASKEKPQERVKKR